jgi:hypothetical protein
MKQRSCDGRGARSAPFVMLNAQKDGCAQRTGAHARPKLTSAFNDIAGYWCVPDAGAGPGGRLLHTHLLLDVCLLQVRSCRGWVFIEITSA